MKKNKIGNELSIGSWITLANPAIAEIMSNSGFDWLAVDMEHSVITIREAEELIRIIELSGVTPMVRLTSNNAELIKRVMAARSHGIIVPNIKTKEDAETAVASAKYPPKGNRGVGLARAQGYGEEFDNYLEWQKENINVIVQIENITAIENAEAIFSTEGINGYILGPYDLSASMGIPGEFDDKDFILATEELTNIAAKASMPSGIHIIEPDLDQLKQRVKENYKIIAYSLDIRMLSSSSIEGVNFFNTLRKDN